VAEAVPRLHPYRQAQDHTARAEQSDPWVFPTCSIDCMSSSGMSRKTKRQELLTGAATKL